MAYKIRAFHCEDCGAWTVRKRDSNGPFVCEACGRERMYLAGAPRSRPVSFTVDGDGEVIST